MREYLDATTGPLAKAAATTAAELKKMGTAMKALVNRTEKTTDESRCHFCAPPFFPLFCRLARVCCDSGPIGSLLEKKCQCEALTKKLQAAPARF